MPRGWIVEVIYMWDGVEVRQRYDVAITDARDALTAVERLTVSQGRVKVRIEEQLFDATFFGLGLAPGDILPRLRYRRYRPGPRACRRPSLF